MNTLDTKAIANGHVQPYTMHELEESAKLGIRAAEYRWQQERAIEDMVQDQSIPTNSIREHFRKSGIATADRDFDLQRGLDAIEECENTDEPSHPLDVAPLTMPELGWIDEYAVFASALTSSPLSFNRLIALVLAASAIQRSATLRLAFGDIRANIYGVIVAPSTAWFKSTALKKADNILHRAQLENILLPAEFTPEGLMRSLAGQSKGLVKRDEIGRLFDSGQVKYLRELKPLLTEIYDGNTVKKQLSHEAIAVTNPYLCIIGATTPSRFYDAVQMIDWGDGFLPRWLFALPEGEPNFDSDAALLTPDDDRRWGELSAMLSYLSIQPDTDFQIDQDAFLHWKRWQSDARRGAFAYGDETASAIVGRYGTYALKFAIVLAAVQKSWGRIGIDHITAACTLSDYYKSIVFKVLTEQSEQGVNAGRMQEVYKFIRLRFKNSAPVTMRDLARKFHLKRPQLAPTVDALVDGGYVLRTNQGKTTLMVPANQLLEALPVRAVGR